MTENNNDFAFKQDLDTSLLNQDIEQEKNSSLDIKNNPDNLSLNNNLEQNNNDGSVFPGIVGKAIASMVLGICGVALFLFL